MDERPDAVIAVDRFDAVIFDMDGVVTDTAGTHAAAWRRLFDEYLHRRASTLGEPFDPFDERSDYLRYVDGKPRYDGVRSFLASRGITIPDGEPDDPVDRETVCGLGNRKDEYFVATLRADGARAYPSTVRLIEQLHAHHVRTALISASRNAAEVLRSAGLESLFEARVDGVVADALQLPGKPDPAVFLEAASRLDVPVERAVVVEDAIAGVEAGLRGGFGFVIAVNRGDQRDALARTGAHVVVDDLSEVSVSGATGGDS